MVVYCWSTVCHAGPSLNQRWVNVLCLLGSLLVDPTSLSQDDRLSCKHTGVRSGMYGDIVTRDG